MAHIHRLAKRMDNIAPSSIRGYARRAIEQDLINLAQGAPDFPAANEVKQAAAQAINSDKNQYSVTWGLRELREEIAHMVAARFGLDADPETQITVTCGVSEGLVATLLATVGAGDEVLVVEPAHENYVPAIRFAGAEPRFLPLEPPFFKLEPEKLERAISKRTRALILNSPHNPTGRVFTLEELRGVAEVAQRHDLLVITDEIYDQITYDGKSHIPLASLEGMAERSISCSGISKVYAVTGWRLGYVLAPAAVSEALRTVHDYLTICAPTPLQHAALTALRLPSDYYVRLREDFTSRRNLMMQALEHSQLAAVPPEGAYYVMADFQRWECDDDDLQFCERLINDAKIATVPGSAFYIGHPELGRQLVRFAFAKNSATLREVSQRLRAAFEKRHL